MQLILRNSQKITMSSFAGPSNSHGDISASTAGKRADISSPYGFNHDIGVFPSAASEKTPAVNFTNARGTTTTRFAEPVAQPVRTKGKLSAFIAKILQHLANLGKKRKAPTGGVLVDAGSTPGDKKTADTTTPAAAADGGKKSTTLEGFRKKVKRAWYGEPPVYTNESRWERKKEGDENVISTDWHWSVQ